MRKIYFILFCFVAFTNKAQTYLMNVTNTVNIASCPATILLYDDGGVGGNYANSQNWERTFTAPPGFCLRVSINYTTESCCDPLRVYDGNSIASPQVLYLAGTGSYGPYTGTSQSMTFRWVTDGSIVNPGFQATITCQAACTGTPAAGVISITASNSVTCPNAGTVTMSSTGGSGCGMSYQWQSASAPSGPWNNIAAPGGIGYSINGTAFNGLTYFRKQTCCGANCVYSNTISIGTGTGAICSLSTYNPATTTYNFEAFVGTNAPSTDDVLFNSTVNLGFQFCYGGSLYTTAFIASNGAIVFSGVPCFPNIQTTTFAAPGVSTGYVISAAAPVNNTSIPRNAILGPWHDIDPSVGGLIEYATLGIAPNRRFVVSYDNVPMFSGSCNTNSSLNFSSQIKIYESTGNIEVHVKQKRLCSSWNGGYAVLGLHNFDGTIYRPPVNATAHNYPTQWTMTNTAYQWTSACANCAVVLPVDFKKFFGERIDHVNKLYWETATEKDIMHFSVERSNDAENFKEIAKVEPKNLPSLYNYDDHETKPGSMYYYRITSVEKSGERNHTNAIPLGSNLNEVLVSGIYPNPVENDFVMSVDARSLTELHVRIYDVVGKMVKEFKPTMPIGVNQIKFSVPELPAGSYMLEVRSSDDQIITQHKLVKVD